MMTPNRFAALGLLATTLAAQGAWASCLDSQALYKQSSQQTGAWTLSHHQGDRLLKVTPIEEKGEESEVVSESRDCSFDLDRLALVLHYELDQFELTAGHKEALLELVVMVEQGGRLALGVSGHADHLGSDQYNLALSRRRAQQVDEFLKRVRPDLVTESYSFGESSPVCSREENALQGCNRRVEIKLIL
ncbi:OmpA family protein [Ferrimonas sediminicola]|uniref:OmpA family protein n=1 Tax=Ferrimonas sediminicola TaxID=2569538 RepID=A0A4U1BD16_9GAMM|nr:OmpA family protein [Ferrimonas sediminicola]TKB48923.1 OmpA family protein [Ferrimonas sediminicola]